MANLKEFDLFTKVKLIEKTWNKEFKKEFFSINNKNVELFAEGPHIIFDTQLIQYHLSYYTFKENSDHTKYKNVVGEHGMIVALRKTDTEKEIIEKFKESLEEINIHILEYA